MVVGKVINNNVISSWDADHNEIIVMGRGIGFQKRPGQTVSEADVEKIFRLENSDVRRQFENLLENIPLENIQVSADIIAYAKEQLNTRLSQNVYLTLTDHISFAITRYREGMDFSNALYLEIKRFYPQQFEIGMHALDLIAEYTGIRLPDDEAASIAIHLVNAQFDTKVRDTWRVTNVIRDTIKILEEELSLPPEDSFRMDCLLSNLKFLSYRMLLMPSGEGEEDEQFYQFVKGYCSREYLAAQKVREHLKKEYQCEMTEEEQIYLTLWIKQTVSFEKQTKKKGSMEDGLI
ncbi:BglG family transcription antiterminator LicT [Candidatus Acetatifactor stercoripullorum]|uniref:BglG family transcription antiterminator LicT n=1 Tax=Candidatus Acetatifactor stercoripullorum TaxID=2838414 RepID=UPI00298E3126|nr:PRD domain-containing protein [Candidatus Acetatifactor stercoripullorum]